MIPTDLAALLLFAGEPDPGGFYSRGNRNDKEMAAKGAAPRADSKGRIGG